MIEAYKTAFLRNYPQKTIEVRPTTRRGVSAYWVIIDGDRGERPLSEDEIRSSTRDFLK